MARVLGIDALERAVAEIAHEVAYYEAHGGPVVAQGFLDELTRVAQRIVEAPRAFPEWPGNPGVRRALLKRYPFTIGFVVGAAGSKEPPLIVVVAHGRRRPGYWLGRRRQRRKRARGR
jgi:plasmid stabilization system protein ParE